MLQHKKFMTKCCVLQRAGIKLTTLSMIDTDYQGRCQYKYYLIMSHSTLTEDNNIYIEHLSTIYLNHEQG